VPATLVQTVNGGACSVDNRFDLTIPPVEVTDAAGAKYTFRAYSTSASTIRVVVVGEVAVGAGCHYNDLGNGSFTLVREAQ